MLNPLLVTNLSLLHVTMLTGFKLGSHTSFTDMKDVKAASHLCCTSDCENYQPLVVLEFDTSAKSASIEWLLAKLQSSKIDNGGNLIVRSLRQQGNKVSSIINCRSELVEFF